MLHKKNLTLMMTAMLLSIASLKSLAQNIQLQIQATTFPGGYHVPCKGTQQGNVQVLASGGVEPYAFLWSNGSTQATLSGVGAGQFSVTVTDANGSSANTSIELFEPNAIQIESVISDYNGYGVRGHGRSDGNILIVPSGGTAPYSILWGNGENTFALNNLPSGNYSFTISDANGCSSSGNANLLAPPALSASLNVIQAISCFEAGDGIAEIIPIGGVPPYRVFWSNGSMEAQAIRLSGGENAAQIEDANGIILDTVLMIPEPDPLVANFSAPTYPNGYHVSCFNCFNGSIQGNVIGGTAPYTADWGGTATGNTVSLNGLDGGLYSVKITDAHGCFLKENISLRMPERNDWTMSGNENVDPQNQFIGTLDNSDVVIKTQGQERMRISGSGETKISGSFVLDSLEENTDAQALFHVLVVDPVGKIRKVPRAVFEYVYDPGTVIGGIGLGCKKQLEWGKPVNVFNGVETVMETDDIVKCPAEGNVGIGTYLPNATSKLDVIGNVAFSGDRLHVGYDGKVGIGTMNPTDLLEVSGNTKVWGKLSTHDEVYNYNSQTGDHLCTSFDGSSARLDYKPTSSNTTGRLLINTDSRREIVLGSHTQVWGQLTACKVVVESASWCDFVFEDNYELCPLLDLEKYLKEHKHLPNVPPAVEVEEQGIDVAQMTRLHMQKIEELTLYVISLQKQIEALKQ